MVVSQIVLTVPKWVIDELGRLPPFMDTLEERMAAVIRFSQLNHERGTGGPFAAGVFERDSGKLITIGVNRVVDMNCSSAHAEVMALSAAQQILGSYDLGAKGKPAHQLVVNWRPCAMCYGAVLWSGIRCLVIAGSGPELEDFTGFDEGPIHPNWLEELNRRGIKVVDGILREDACRVFVNFKERGSLVYNSRQGDSSR